MAKWVRRALVLLPLAHATLLVALLAARQVAEWPPGPLARIIPAHLWGAGRSAISLVDELLPFLFVPLPAWLLIAALVRTRMALVAAGVPWLLFGSLYGEVFVHRPAHLPVFWRAVPPAATGDAARTADLRVMTFNLLFVNGSADQVAAAVLQAEPDVLAVQELSPGLAAALDQALQERYPYHDLRPQDSPDGIGVWSRHPLQVEERWGGAPGLPLDGPRRQHVSIDLTGRRVHVVNLHLSPPEIHLGRLPRLPLPFGVPLYAGESAEQRRREAAALAPPLGALAQEPLIVAGDLNLTDQTAEYRLLRGVGLRDAYRETGWGFGLTYPARPKVALRGRAVPIPPLVRIDYVFHSSHFAARRSQVLAAATGSDHRPVVADLRLHLD